MRLKRAIIPYLVLFESSQLLHLSNLVMSYSSGRMSGFKRGGGGKGAAITIMAKFSDYVLGDKGLEHRQPPQACIPTNPRFLMFLHFGKNGGHVLSQAVITSGLLFLPCSQTHVRTSNISHCIPLSTEVLLG